MGLFSKITGVFKKKEKKTSESIAPQQMAPVRNIDFGSTAKGSPDRVAGISVYNSQVGGARTITRTGSKGGTGENYNIEVPQTSNFPTPQTIATQKSLNKTYNANIGKLQPAKNYSNRETRQDLTPVRNDYVALSPYVKREVTIGGYTKSGKVIEKATDYYIDPFAYQEGRASSDIRLATKEEASILPPFKSSIKYNPEDYLSYSQLGGNFPAMIRRGGYDVGKLGISAIAVPYKAISGKEFSPSLKAKGRAILGEGILFTTFSPVMTTASQRAFDYAKPTKIKELGYYQTKSKGGVETDIVFEANKGGNIYRGRATGQAFTKELDKGYISVGGVKGTASQRALRVTGLKNVNPSAFASTDIAIGRKVGENVFIEGFGGKASVVSKNFKGAFDYGGGGIQAIGSKGSIAFGGGSSSKLGSSVYAGIVFPTAIEKTIKFIPLSAKGGQFGFNPSTINIIPKSSLGIASAGSSTITRAGISAFATTITPIASVSFAPIFSSSLIKIGSNYKPSTINRYSNVSISPSLNTSKQNFKLINTSPIRAYSSLNNLDLQRTRGGFAFNSSAILTSLKQGNKQILRLNTPTSQGQRLRSPTIRIPFNEAPTERKPYIFNFRFGGLELPSNVFKGGKRRTGYTPSFSALVFNIKGSYKSNRLSRSGLNFRPITKGFSFPTGIARKRRKKLYVF